MKKNCKKCLDIVLNNAHESKDYTGQPLCETHTPMSQDERFERAKRVGRLLNGFKLFAMDSIMEGRSDGVTDHIEFLKRLLEFYCVGHDLEDEATSEAILEVVKPKR